MLAIQGVKLVSCPLDLNFLFQARKFLRPWLGSSGPTLGESSTFFSLVYYICVSEPVFPGCLLSVSSAALSVWLGRVLSSPGASQPTSSVFTDTQEVGGCPGPSVTHSRSSTASPVLGTAC